MTNNQAKLKQPTLVDSSLVKLYKKNQKKTIEIV